MAKPEIRLKEFEGEWLKTTIGNITYSHPATLVLSNLATEGGSFPVYGASGFITNVDFYHQNVPYIGVVKDGAGVGNIFVCPAYSSILGTMHYIFPKERHDLFFLSLLLEKVDLSSFSTGSTIPHIYYSDYSSKEVFIPSEQEQKAISTYFESLDSMLQSTTKKIASLKQVKQACLVSMFPQAGETTPRVRFKGFEGEWNYLSMSDIFMERHDISTIMERLPQLSFTIEEGVIRPEDRKTNKRDFLIKDKSNKKYLVTRLDDIIYNPANVIYGAIHKNSLCDGVVSPIYKIFYTQQDPSFMECVVRRPEFIQEMTIYMEGTVQKLRTLKPEAFLRMSAYIAPSLEEQKKIGNYFRTLDKQISLQEKRLEKLKQIKAACLDKMFV